MAEKNTQGAVHLTSLALDLTQFNENIQQIQNATAQAADVSVQNLAKIRDALNIPVENMTLNVNTQQFTQGMNEATQATNQLKNSYGNLTKEIQGGQLFSSDVGAMESLVKSLGIADDKIEESVMKLATLGKELDEYSKISISTSGGELFRAIVTSSNEAGQSIRKVIDLTQEVEKITVDSAITISDNAEKRAKSLKIQADSVDVLKLKLSDLNKVVEALTTKFTSEDIQLQFPEVAEQAAKFRDEVQKVNSELKVNESNVQEANRVYDTLWKTQSALSKTWSDITRQARESSSAVTVDVDQINRLALQFANLANTLQKSKWSENSVVKALAEDAKQAENELKLLVSGIATGNITVEEAIAEYDKWAKRLTFLKTEFADTGYEQQEFLKKSEQAQKLADGYDALQLKLAKLATTMSNYSIKFDTPELQSLIAETQTLQGQAANAAQELREVGSAADITEDDLEQLDQRVKSINLAFEANKKSNADYKKSLQPIEQQAKETVSALKVLEKSATFTTSKQKVAELRAEYEQFINKLKNTHVGTDEAERELAELQQRFTELEGTIKTGHTWLETWVNKISESAKWQIANSALNLIRQSFGDLTGTIIETENAVIELQRVLGDKSLSNSAISDELYQIAYDFGQTFDAVQETAVKFAQTGMDWQDTVEATRVTMLALNTAELEVSTATEGLIAVMAQFGIEANDLEVVIDKINKTADNFPITSEKIVAALQRAGGTANAFGLSLEETIGIITALGEATGRAGEAIGTAMNSLISFSMKDTSLAKFSEFLGKDVTDYGVLQLWKELSEAIKGAGDEGAAFAKKMATSAEFSGLMNEELASAIGLTEEYNKATEETNKMLKDGKDIYSVVGTYRQNYFIALLNNIDTAVKAIKGMGDAVGYSMRENETAMEAFSKKWNQLVVSAQELAIQFGNAGFLDLMKGAVEASSAVLKLSQSFGGLRTVMLATSTLFFTMKKDKIDEKFNNLKTAVTATKAAVTAYNTATAAGATATTAFSAAVGALKLTFGGFVAIASLVATALSAVFGWMKQTREEADRARQEAVEAGAEAVQKSKELSEAYREYDKARSGGSSDEREASTEKLIQLLGYEISDIEILTKRYGSLEEAIESLMDAEYERNKEAAKNAYEAKKSEEEFQKVQRQSIEIAQEDKRVVEELNKAGYDYSNWILALNRTGRDIKFAFEIPDFSSAQQQLDKYNDMLETMGGILTSDERANSKLYQSVLKARDALSAYITEVEDLKAKYEQYGMSREEYDRNMAEAEEKFNAAMKEANATIEQSIMSLEDMEDAIDALNKKMDSFQSSVKTVQDIVEQYNETGVMTADMLQSLIALAPEYIELIDINSNSLSVNQEKLESLMQVNDNYMVQLAAMKIQKEYEALATELQKEEYDNLTAAEITNMLTTEALNGEVYDLAMQFLTGKKTADQFNAEIQNMATKSGLAAEKAIALGNAISGMTGNLSEFLKVANMNFTGTFSSNLLDGHTFQEWADMFDKKQIDFATYQKYWNRYQLGQFDAPTVSATSSSGTKTWFPSTSSSKSSSSSSSDPYKAEKDALNDLLDAYEHSIFLIEKNEKTSQSSADKIVAIYRQMQSEIHATAEDYRQKMGVEDDEYTRGLSEKWWQIQETIEKVLQGVYEETVRTYNAALNNLEHQYESAEQRLDYSYMGENLKKQLDYQVKIQREAERELERLAKLGMDANSEAAQDVIDTWYEAEKAIREISQKISADILEPYDDFIDLADHFELWEYMDFTKVDYLRDKLTALNKLLEEGTITAKEYNAQLKSLSYAIYDAQKELYEQEKQTVSDNLKGTVDAYKAEQEALKKQKDQLNDYYDTVIDGYNKEIEAWNKKKEQVEDYYDTLIDNLRDVEKANERINKQVDYYNARQKIITNLEQAQARSGVEWREKEMEYQQQLIELDEEWRRTLEEWSIEDQITALEKLKESALADIDLSIQKIRDTITMTEEAKNAALEAIEAEINAINDLITAAEEAAEAEIEVINDKIKDMSKTIADAIKDGTVDGLVNSREELDKALVDGTNAMLAFIDQNETAMENSALQTASNVYGTYDTYFITPMNDSISDIASTMSTAIASGAEEGAKQALNTFQTSFIAPLKNELADLMRQANASTVALRTLQMQTVATAATTGITSNTTKITEAQKFAFNAGAGPVSVPKPITANTTFNKDLIKTASSNIFITNINRGTEDAVDKTQRTLAAFGYK